MTTVTVGAGAGRTVPYLAMASAVGTAKRDLSYVFVSIQGMEGMGVGIGG